MPDTPVTRSTGISSSKADTAAEDRAAFDKIAAKIETPVKTEETGVVSGTSVRKLDSPEKIWNEAAAQKARFAKKKGDEKPSAPEPAPVADRSAERADEPTDTEQDGGDDDQENPELERAKTALLRSGFRKKELASMSHKEILTRGLARARALEATDEAWNLAKSAKAVAPKADSSKTETTPSEQLPDLKEALQPLAKELLLDERGAAALEEAFRKILTPIVAKAASQPAANTGRDELSTNLEAARKELIGMYPQLVDPIIVDQVTAQMDALSASPKYRVHGTAKDAFRAVMQDACMVLGLDAEEVEADTDRDDDRKARRHSRSTPTGKSSVNGAASANPDRAAYDHIMAHPGDVRGAQRAAGRS